MREKKIQYTVYVDQELDNLIESMSQDLKISKNAFITSHLKEITKYSSPYTIIIRKIKTIEFFIDKLIQENKELLEAANDAMEIYEKIQPDNKEGFESLKQKFLKYQSINHDLLQIKESVDIIKEKIEYII